LTLNSVVEISRPTANAISDFVFFQQRETVIAPLMTGRYEDVFDCSGGEWLLKHRVVRVDMLTKATEPHQRN